MWLQTIIKTRRAIFILIVIVSFILTYNAYLLKEDETTLILSKYDQRSDSLLSELYNGSEDYLINTTGCYIPNYGKEIKFIKAKNYKKTCGERAIFIERKGNDDIAFKINSDILKVYIKKSLKDDTVKYNCCYKFASRSEVSGQEDTHLSYTNCKHFEDSTTVALREEVVTVSCYNKKKQIFYKDSYIIIKKKVFQNHPSNETEEKPWNVLMLGMDTMSRARVLSTMPNTVQYFEEHDWLDYKGYQKVGSNTFPNLMGVLTGASMDTIYKLCKDGLDDCNDLIIWSKFRDNGYATAYGEDYLSLPDTFTRYNGFKTKPTHHYMRPFFLTGEKHVGNLMCVNHIPSAKHLLNYAYDFVDSYKKNKFFGFFWINSYSHNVDNIPSGIDSEIVDFFEQLENIGIMDNTFIIFFSDHGIRFGNNRLQMESYYEERLPMFFVWTPLEFRTMYSEKYYNLTLNQNRLVTPYDLHATLAEISNTIDDDDVITKACPECTSLFEAKSLHRTCSDAGVSDKWCSCHKMTKSDNKNAGADKSLNLAVSFIQNKSYGVETIDCWKCSPLKLIKIHRIHSYVDIKNRTNYVVAFEMAPGNVSYEATVVENDNEYTILQPTDTISPYNTRGNCVKIPNARVFCVCEPVKCKDNDNG